MLMDSEARVSSLKRSLLGLEHDHRQAALGLAQGTCSTSLSVFFYMAWCGSSTWYPRPWATGEEETGTVIVTVAVSSKGTETIIMACTEPLKQMYLLFVCMEPSSAMRSQTPVMATSLKGVTMSQRKCGFSTAGS